MFYAPDIRETLTLPEEESQHCVQVLRAAVGDRITVTDGRGTIYEAEVTNPHRKHCQVRLVSESRPEPLHEGHVHLAFAPTKNIDRVEWMLEKCTELGVDAFTPLLCRHSERKVVNDERLQKIVVSAAKQSLKATFPVLHPMLPLRDFIRQSREADCFIAHCIPSEEGGEAYGATADKQALQHQLQRGHDVVILIGPEGDFSEEEVAEALEAGFRPISLGRARLRTETAGLAAAHTAILFNS